MTTTVQQLADRLFPVIESKEEVEVRNIPPEQRRLHTETADLTVSSLHGLLSNGKIVVPEFQRGYVWNRTQASKLIESLIIQCPIPVIYFSQQPDNTLIVVDGNQRLMTIKLFLNDGFPLQGLTTYPELNNYSWSQLDPRFRDHINNRTIRCITILKDTHPQIKFDVFERLNTGSVKLNGQELRHGINHGPLMEGIDDLTKNETWKRLSGIKQDKRMKGAELILRFFAMRYNREKYEKPLSSFLDAFSATNKSISDQNWNTWRTEFLSTLDLVEHYLGKQSFKILTAEGVAAGSFNSAVFDAQMVGFAETSSNAIRNKNADVAAVRAAIAGLFGHQQFGMSVQRATSDESSVAIRINKMIELLNGF